MSTFKASSGAEVVINIAPWKDAKNLKKTIEREIASLGIDFTSEPVAIIAMKLDGSDAIDAALWPCLIRCLRNGEKITETTFDDIDARQDYYDIVQACVKENLGPLADSLFSKFSAFTGISMKQAEPAQK